MMWDYIIEQVVALLRLDPVMQDIYGENIRMAATGEQQVPGLQISLLGDVEQELWTPILIQFDQFIPVSDSTNLKRSEHRLRGLFQQDLPTILGEVQAWMRYEDGTTLSVPDRSGILGRAVRFRLTPLRLQYALQSSAPVVIDQTGGFLGTFV